MDPAGSGPSNPAITPKLHALGDVPGTKFGNYLGARYYSGAAGRFTSPDAPFADQQPDDPKSWNMYSYARNNPLRFVDPSGRACVYIGADDGDPSDPKNYRDEGTTGQTCAQAFKREPTKDYDSRTIMDLWQLGLLQSTERFHGDDRFTQQVRQSSHLTWSRNMIRRAFNNCRTPPDGHLNRNLRLNGPHAMGPWALGVYAFDAVNIPGGGIFGDHAQSILGSYRLGYSLSNVDLNAGKTNVTFLLTNDMDLSSATAIPLTDLSILSNRTAGLGASSMIEVTWTETIGFNNSGCPVQ